MVGEVYYIIIRNGNFVVVVVAVVVVVVVVVVVEAMTAIPVGRGDPRRRAPMRGLFLVEPRAKKQMREALRTSKFLD
jgi:hypothetical protein